VTDQITSGPDETERAGAELAGTLKPGDVVLVSGELGAGKTTFVRGALRALGVEGPITSPTFVVGHFYDRTASRRESRPLGDTPSDASPQGESSPVAHLDLYRLAGMGGEDPGILDPFFAPETIVFVEWPEHAQDAFPADRVAHRVRLAHAGGDERRIEVQ
jgi:tRNA threonylcarbamoyladenosine biosynthesis protein TsaE